MANDNFWNPLNQLLGNDLDETTLFDKGLRCRVFSGTDTYLIAGDQGDRELTRAEARALIGQMVSCSHTGLGKVTGYIELRRPDQPWVYGVDVKWSKHSPAKGAETMLYFGSFYADGLQLLEGQFSEQARREWDRQEVMTEREFDEQVGEEQEQRVQRFESQVASLVERGPDQKPTQQIDQDQGIDV